MKANNLKPINHEPNKIVIIQNYFFKFKYVINLKIILDLTKLCYQLLLIIIINILST